LAKVIKVTQMKIYVNSIGSTFANFCKHLFFSHT